MASPTGRRLTEAHRLAQSRLGADTVRLLVAAFPLLDPHDIEATFDRFLSVVLPIIQSQRAQSAALASAYLTTFQALEIGSDRPFTPVLVGDAPVEQVQTVMLVTGPIALRDRMTRMTEQAAVSMTAAGLAGAGMRLVLGAGRETITGTIQADPRAKGYERVTSGNSCDFCEMLAGRGAVYGAASADFEAHARCNCSAQPVYEDDTRGSPIGPLSEFTPTDRRLTDTQRAVRNERVREFIRNSTP